MLGVQADGSHLMELSQMSALVRYTRPDIKAAALGLLLENTVYDLSESYRLITAWLDVTRGNVSGAIADLEGVALKSARTFPADNLNWLPPIDLAQEVWAAGVTYERSRAARQEEAIDGGDVYARVYGAQRPELFFKGRGHHVVGHLGEVGIRSDATWSVPEPELAVVFNSSLEVVGFTVGNDMSSRDIEGENPLYLPQAKVYTAACALGPGIVLSASTEFPQATIRMTIVRAGQTAFTGEVHTDRIRRTIRELADYLGRCNTYPDGVVLLTGTGIVPPSDFTLAAGDEVTISIEGIGTLKNTVKVV
jgi:2-dehydro-3-deoxy-D-arabinonate dehydratase